ncbi:GDYXXLXY domain-containing protein [Paenisporosarcina sp. TG-14]|uniref:GDYXXLXY domain-containing protein n=1 Tax=Paenisporosarcina sp. TG-14 TaxID=1231057 RepID=UPI000317FD07|nr:GDYXXLXY domain-containing protein [Paenisporosarcina sp. TG-14]
MKNLSKNKLFLISLLLPVILLLSMTVKPLITIYYGETVRLQTVPVDPSNLFYGDYVDLDFEAENIAIDVVEKSLRKRLEDNTTGSYPQDDLKVYILLAYSNETETHKVTSLTVSKPKSGTYIKGILTPYINEGKVRVSIPIEQYYLEDDTGSKLEDQARKGELIATIKVHKGYAILRSVD